MKTGISVEWGYLSRRVNNIVIRKLRKLENVGPIILLITQKASEILFQCLVCSFRLPVGLRMVAGGEVTRDLEHLEEMLPKFGDELRSPVIDDNVREVMMPKYLTHDKGSGLLASDGLSTRSTTVKIASNPFETGRSVIKSRQIDCHVLLGIGKGSNKT